ncbi:MAG: ATP-binding cassette domain-containing protein [Alphaproteobacteria bacterium]|jgi:cell division transport system ATP-binding protein|nr:ATP-binding cassette domain-containing protein [Alphaproteobacteria bacterium]MDP6515782.1 ATP-binding cassette domain-containing protein [Alphaproteobacteria bacterium]
MGGANSVVRFENVGMRYGLGPEVLHDVTFFLRPGAFYFLTGPSGAGKSSLLRLLCLAHLPSHGLVTLFEQDVATAGRVALCAMRRKIGIVFQDFRLLDHLSTRNNAALPLRIDGLAEADIDAAVEELLAWVGLADSMEAPPSTLSGGDKQRLAIARAVIRRPDLLLADEPTGNVDPDNSLRLLRLFEELHKLGTTVIIATHDHWLMSQFRYPRLRLDQGHLIVEGHPEMAAQ